MSACMHMCIVLIFQLGRIYLDMLNVYKVMSENVSSAIATNGENVTKQPLIKSMRTVKKETLKLISGWVSRSNEPQMVSMWSHVIMSFLVLNIEYFWTKLLHFIFRPYWGYPYWSEIYELELCQYEVLGNRLYLYMEIKSAYILEGSYLTVSKLTLP